MAQILPGNYLSFYKFVFDLTCILTEKGVEASPAQR